MSSEPHNEPRAIPHAGRPRGDAWRALQAEGIEWEAQVLLGKDDRPLSARLIVTSQRLAFARGGVVVLDISRWWLKRPPYLSGNGAINLRIETGSGVRDRLQFVARDGREAATDLVTLLTHGKQALPSAPLEHVYTQVPERVTPRRQRTVEPDLIPDVEQLIARADEHKYAPDVINATTLQILETTDFPPMTEAASPTTHRESTPRGGRGSSDPITISTLANQTHRSGDWSLNPIPAMHPRSEGSSKASWAFRLSGLIVLIALAVAFGANRLPSTSDLPGRGNSINAPGFETSTPLAAAQTIPTSTPTLALASNATEPTRTSAGTAVSQGVGGETIEATASAAALDETATIPASGDSTEDATVPSDPEPSTTEAAIETATEDTPVDPTETGATEPSATAPESTASETAVTEFTATETSAPTETIVPEVTATEIGTTEPTVTSTSSPVPTDSETSEPTETLTPEPTSTPGFSSQARTVDENGAPDQVFATGAFRYTIEYAERAAEIPNLELPAVAEGEWVVVVLHAENWSDEPATINMADFQLLVSGDFGWQFIGMDASSSDISQFLGFDPVLEEADLSSIKDGEGIRMALVFMIPRTTTGMELIDDTSGLSLNESLAIGGDVTDLGTAPVRPNLIAAVVTEVLDGQTIVVEADGYSATIQYLGITVPTGDQCFAGDATVANSNIVLGQTVYLEREFRNRVTSDQDILARDVWIDNQQGGLVLVAAWLASEGVAAAAPADQDTRFAGWILAAAGSAEANGLGYWAVCGGPPVAVIVDPTADNTNQVSLPIDQLLRFDT